MIGYFKGKFDLWVIDFTKKINKENHVLHKACQERTEKTQGLSDSP